MVCTGSVCRLLQTERSGVIAESAVIPVAQALPAAYREAWIYLTDKQIDSNTVLLSGSNSNLSLWTAGNADG